MAKTKILVSMCLIVGIRAEVGPSGDCVSAQWRTAAIALAVVLVLLGLVTVVRILLPRWLKPKNVHPANDEPQISIIECGIHRHKGKVNITSNVQDSFNIAQNDPKLKLDLNLARNYRKEQFPGINIQPPSECNTPTIPGTSEWVASTPPPAPPGTLLWVPSTARRRSVSLRGECDEDVVKSDCSTCCTDEAVPSPTSSVAGTPPESPSETYRRERKRSVTFNESVKEIHVLSPANEPKRQNRSRSPSLVLAGAFYVR